MQGIEKDRRFAVLSALPENEIRARDGILSEMVRLDQFMNPFLFMRASIFGSRPRNLL